MRTAKTDQIGQMPRLIWVFAGRTCHFVGLMKHWWHKMKCSFFIIAACLICENCKCLKTEKTLQTYVRKFSKTRIQNSGQTRFKTDWNEWERKAIQEWRTWAKSLKDAADGQTYRSPFTFREEKRRKKINILTIKHEKNNRFPRTSMELFCMRIFFFQDKPIINS